MARINLCTTPCCECKCYVLLECYFTTWLLSLKLANPRRQLHRNLHWRYFHKDTQNSSRISSNLFKFNRLLQFQNLCQKQTSLTLLSPEQWRLQTLLHPPKHTDRHAALSHKHPSVFRTNILPTIAQTFVSVTERTPHLWEHQYHIKTTNQLTAGNNSKISIHTLYCSCYLI